MKRRWEERLCAAADGVVAAGLVVRAELERDVGDEQLVPLTKMAAAAAERPMEV